MSRARRGVTSTETATLPHGCATVRGEEAGLSFTLPPPGAPPPPLREVEGRTIRTVGTGFDIATPRTPSP
jgi:hypothetical protein